jgi:hypothetical protein
VRIEGENPEIIIGWFINDKFTGKGRLIFEDSLSNYEGDFFDYLYEGNGTLKSFDGEEVYSGTFD